MKLIVIKVFHQGIDKNQDIIYDFIILNILME